MGTRLVPFWGAGLLKIQTSKSIRRRHGGLGGLGKIQPSNFKMAGACRIAKPNLIRVLGGLEFEPWILNLPPGSRWAGNSVRAGVLARGVLSI